MKLYLPAELESEEMEPSHGDVKNISPMEDPSAVTEGMAGISYSE